MTAFGRRNHIDRFVPIADYINARIIRVFGAGHNYLGIPLPIAVIISRLQQTPCRILHQIQHMLEPTASTVVGIGYFLLRMVLRVIEQ